MNLNRRRPYEMPLPRRRLALLGALAAVLLAGLLTLAPAGAQAASTQVVRYHGWSARIPASWPVYRLARQPQTCVRFNRHAVYLGRPGAAERCPTHAAGHTEAILVAPGVAATDSVASPGSAAVVVRRTAGVTVTATWDHRPALVRSALGAGSVPAVRADARAYARRFATGLRGAAARARAAARATARTAAVAHGGHADAVTIPTTVSAAATPGETYTGLGFDACSAPSTATMTAWGSSPFRALGVYLGGTNMACSQTNLNAAWVSAEAAAGWHLIPTYVGLQAPTNGCGCASISATQAAAQGTAAAQNAVAEAQALGLGAGNPIYYDMENYTRTTTASETVLTFLGAWTTALHEAGYSSGVYSSELSGVEDLVAEQGTGYGEPDDIWVANWNGQESTTDPGIPATDWADNQRLHQYRGGHTDDYGGVPISIDSDYLDAATAAPGATTVTSTIAAAPTVTLRPEPDGSIRIAPSWSGVSGVTRWAISAGSGAGSLSPLGALAATKPALLADSGDTYFQAQALNAAGAAIGTSGVIAAPTHVALFGRTAFVASTGPGGLPVECFGISACRVTTTVVLGHRRLAKTGLEGVPAGGGIVHFTLTAAEHRLVARAGNAGIPVTVTARTSTGRTATRAMKLVRFTTTGRGPRRLAGSSRAVRILGVTDFVSHGFSGGILVACRQSTPCRAAPTLRLGRRTLSSSKLQTIGANEIGYLSFTMNPTGHTLLMHARGNQLGVSLSVLGSSAGLTVGDTAHALIAIDAF